MRYLGYSHMKMIGSMMKKSLTIFTAGLLTACVTITNEELARNQSLFDFSCKSDKLIVGPTAAYEDFTRRNGSTYLALCEEKGNNWRALYSCTRSSGSLIHETKCKLIEHKEIKQNK